MIKGKDQSITLTGSWQKLNLPQRYLFLQFFNDTSSTLDVAKNVTTGVYNTLQNGDAFQYDVMVPLEAYEDEIWVKGSTGQTVKYEVQADQSAIDALT